MKKILFILIALLAFSCCSTKLTEKVEVAFPNGQPQIVRYYDKNGVCVKQTEYYETGQVYKEGGIKNDVEEGEWRAYFPDGRLQVLGYFKDGKRSGTSTVYRSTGQLYMEGFYKEGHHCGKWKFYDEQGYLIREDDYGE